MSFKTLDDANLSGKRALVRVDFNVPMQDGEVSDDTRLRAAIPTIEKLRAGGAKVILLAHFDRPKGKFVPSMSLAPIAPALSKVLGQPVGFVGDCAGSDVEAAVAAMKAGDVILLENVRFYPGEEKNDPQFAQALARNGDLYVNAPESEWLVLFRKAAVADMMEMIKTDLALLGIHHDLFSSEAELHEAGKAEAAEAELRARGLIYDGELEKPKGKEIEDWEPVTLPLFRSTQFGDDQDRPIKKSNGSWTYFGADLAYHYQKSQNVDAMVDIWGADHAGTVKRIKAAVNALTGGKVEFDIKLVQMVRLLRGGEPIKMSKRSGSFITLSEMVEEVGKDVVRFTMLTRKSDAQMDFDFAKVVEASKDNPVFYVQYAHARIQSTLRKAEAEGLGLDATQLSLLGDAEIALIREAANFPRIVEAAGKASEPHRIAFYLSDLAAAFHAYWNLGNDQPDKRFILAHNPALTGARLFMAANIGQVIRNGLRLMGVEAANSM